MWAVDRLKKQAETASQRLVETAARAQDVIAAAAAEDEDNPAPRSPALPATDPSLPLPSDTNSPPSARKPPADGSRPRISPSSSDVGDQDTQVAQLAARLREAERLNAQLRSDKEAAERQADELVERLALVDDRADRPEQPEQGGDHELRERLERAEAARDVTAEQLDQATQVAQDLQRRMALADDETKELERTTKNSQLRADQLDAQLAQLEQSTLDERDMAQARIEELTASLEAEQGAAAERTKENQSEIKELKIQLGAAESELQTMNEKRKTKAEHSEESSEELDGQIRVLREQLASRDAQLSQQDEKLRSDYDQRSQTAIAKISQLEQEVSELSNEKAEVLREYEKRNSYATALEQQLADLQSDAKPQDLVSDLERSLLQQREQAESVTKHNDALQSKVDLLAEQLRDSEESKSLLSGTIQRLEAQAEEVDRLKAQLQKEGQEAERLAERTSEQLATCISQTEHASKVEESAKVIARLESELLALQEETGRLRDHRASADESERRQLATMKEQLEAEMEEGREVRLLLAGVEAEKSGLQAALDKHANERDAEEGKYVDLQRSHDQLSSEKEAIEKLLDDLQDEKALAEESSAARIGTLERDLAEKEEHRREMLKELNVLRSQSASFDRATFPSEPASTGEISRSEAERSATLKEEGQLGPKLREMELEVSELRARVADRDDLDNLLSEMESEMEETRSQLVRERDARKRFEVQVKEVGVLCEQLTSQLERKNQELSDMENKYLSLEEKNLDADYQIEDLKSSIYDEHIYRADKLSKELESLRVTHGSTKESLTSATHRLRDLESETERNRVLLAEAEAEAQMHLQASENLQRVLEEFQAARDADIDTNVGLLQRKLSSAEQAARAAKEEAEERAESAKRLANLLSSKEDEINQYRQDVERLTESQLEVKQALEESLSRVHQKDLEKELVDRRVVRALLISYFQVNSKRRRDVLDLMARMLEFGEEDRELVGLTRRRLREVLGSFVKPPEDDGGIQAVGSVSEQWVEYLMHETEPDQDDGF